MAELHVLSDVSDTYWHILIVSGSKVLINCTRTKPTQNSYDKIVSEARSAAE